MRFEPARSASAANGGPRSTVTVVTIATASMAADDRRAKADVADRAVAERRAQPGGRFMR